ncbi:MAG: hypothetical protein HQ567_35065 [Candidatus Nealsonbacteria bacterium]|nr:hypothetical protein [Candidatus Nealsonbacteria bacterium]
MTTGFATERLSRLAGSPGLSPAIVLPFLFFTAAFLFVRCTEHLVGTLILLTVVSVVGLQLVARLARRLEDPNLLRLNHLLLDDGSYDEFVEQTREYWHHYETGMEGPFLLQNRLFSFLKPAEYLEAFKKAGYSILHSQVVLSEQARRFRRESPNQWDIMKRRYGLRDVDLLAKGCCTLCLSY